MSRGYIEGEGDETNPVYLIAHTWVERAIRGKRGQSMLRDLADALDAMPAKRLVHKSFTCTSGVCTLGALGKVRGLDMSELESIAGKLGDDYDEDFEIVSELNDATAIAFGVARSMVADVMWRNDLHGSTETPEARWERMRRWVASQIREGT